jgi:hypothetical protein
LTPRNKGFANATTGNLWPIKERIDTFNSFFTEETLKGKLMGTVKGIDFKKALFSIWLGEKPVDSSLK